jgi:hypothetical protein
VLENGNAVEGVGELTTMPVLPRSSAVAMVYVYLYAALEDECESLTAESGIESVDNKHINRRHSWTRSGFSAVNRTNRTGRDQKRFKEHMAI